MTSEFSIRFGGGWCRAGIPPAGSRGSIPGATFRFHRGSPRRRRGDRPAVPQAPAPPLFGMLKDEC